MQRYTFVHPLILSFFSRSLYQDVARNWRGLCLSYLISLVALCMIPSVLRLQADVSTFAREVAPKIIRKLPAITVVQGKLSIDKPEPYIIRNENTGEPLIIIDTTGSIASLANSKAFLLLTKDTMFIKRVDDDITKYKLSENDNFFIDKGIAYTLVDSLEEWFGFIAFPFAVIFSFSYHFVTVLFYSLIGKIFTQITQISLDFRCLIRLAAISLTPSLLLGAFTILVGIMIPGWWLISFLVSMGYLLYAIRVNAHPGEETS